MPWLAEEQLDHSKLNSGEGNLGTSGMKGSPSRDVNGEVVGHDRSRFSVALNSTKSGSQPSQELLNSNWLGHVVIRPCVKHNHNMLLFGNLGTTRTGTSV